MLHQKQLLYMSFFPASFLPHPAVWLASTLAPIRRWVIMCRGAKLYLKFNWVGLEGKSRKTVSKNKQYVCTLNIYMEQSEDALNQLHRGKVINTVNKFLPAVLTMHTWTEDVHLHSCRTPCFEQYLQKKKHSETYNADIMDYFIWKLIVLEHHEDLKGNSTVIYVCYVLISA